MRIKIVAAIVFVSFMFWHSDCLAKSKPKKEKECTCPVEEMPILSGMKVKPAIYPYKCPNGKVIQCKSHATPDFGPALIKKPAIYLYPTAPTAVNIKFLEQIKLTIDVPKYDGQKGWNVRAYPDGHIEDLQSELTRCNVFDPKQFGLEYAQSACNNNLYPYIYWEGSQSARNVPESTLGWVVKKKNIADFLSKRLEDAGFNSREKSDFLSYWVPALLEKGEKSYFIYFLQNEEVENYIPMSVKPQPDSINRFYMVASPKIPCKKTSPQKLDKMIRNGFTLLEWGGQVSQ